MTTVVPAARGATITRDGNPVWVFADCGELTVAFWCQTHQLEFPTKGHLSAHVKAVDGEHVVARYCPKHGFEAPTLQEKPAP